MTSPDGATLSCLPRISSTADRASASMVPSADASARFSGSARCGDPAARCAAIAVARAASRSCSVWVLVLGAMPYISAACHPGTSSVRRRSREAVQELRGSPAAAVRCRDSHCANPRSWSPGLLRLGWRPSRCRNRCKSSARRSHLALRPLAGAVPASEPVLVLSGRDFRSHPGRAASRRSPRSGVQRPVPVPRAAARCASIHRPSTRSSEPPRDRGSLPCSAWKRQTCSSLASQPGVSPSSAPPSALHEGADSSSRRIRSCCRASGACTRSIFRCVMSHCPSTRVSVSASGAYTGHLPCFAW